MELTCGIDWAESHHDVALVDGAGQTIANLRIGTDAAGFADLMELIAEHGGSPSDTPIGIETDKNLLVTALVGAGFTVYPINPLAMARYRERHSQARTKSDRADAVVLAHVLRTDRHLHRRVPQASEQAQVIRVLARQHQEAIWAVNQSVSRLRAVLLEFYPQAVAAFSSLKQGTALTFLAAVPNPAKAARLTPARTLTLLRKAGRGSRQELATQILTALKTPALRQPVAVEEAYALTVVGQVQIIVAMQATVAALEKALDEHFQVHDLAPILTSAPGLGPVLGARLLSEIGDDPDRFETAQGLRAFAGTAPVTRASGKSKLVIARTVRNKRLADACHWWAFASLTKSPACRDVYDRRRAAGDHHNAALRNLANKLLGRMWWCLEHNQEWDEEAAWPDYETTPLAAAA
jgi:transposase